MLNLMSLVMSWNMMTVRLNVMVCMIYVRRIVELCVVNLCLMLDMNRRCLNICEIVVHSKLIVEDVIFVHYMRLRSQLPYQEHATDYKQSQ